MNKETGGPAFPGNQARVVIPPELAEAAKAIQFNMNGMTLRDYATIKFAAAWTAALAPLPMGETREQLAVEAVRLGSLQADAMLKAREA